MTYYVVNKWGRAKKTVQAGVKYDSGFEASYARELNLRVKAGDIEGFDSHVRIPLVVNGYHIADYYIDFVIYHKDGTREYVETKGIKTRDWALKWKIFEAMMAQEPNVKLTLVQQKRFRMRKIRKEAL
jgi:hypothetical protein